MTHAPDKKSQLDRREFLIGSTSLALAAGVGLACSDDGGKTPDAGRDLGLKEGPAADGPACSGGPQPLPQPASPAIVVDVQDLKSVGTGGTIDAVRVKAMLAAGLTALAKQTDIKQAWKTLIPDFAPSMRIGIKLNCLSSYLYNSAVLVKALVETLVQDLGADAAKIIVWDRRTDELARSKLSDATVGAKVVGTHKTTKDTTGPGYEAKGECVLTQQTHLSRILTEETDITINIPLLKTHTVSGITGAMKNAYGCIDNPGNFHGDIVHQIPAIYHLDRVRQRMRLHITEALLAVAQGSTEDPPDATPGRLLLSADPLALDSHALEVVNALRAKAGGQPVDSPRVGWLDEAKRLNLGTRTVDLKAVNL